jgi:fatty acid amide hydrolase 2
MVPGTGQWPISENEALRYLTTGPIARRAEDLFPYLQVVAGPDGEDEQCRPFELGDPATVSIDGLEVITVADNGSIRVSSELRQAQRRVADHLANLGARVREIHIDGLKHSFEIWGAMMEAAGGTSFRELLGEGEPIPLAREMLRFARGRSDHTLPALALAVLEKLPTLKGERGAKLVRRGHELQRHVEEQMGDGIMLYPSYSCTAPPHRGPLRRPFDWVYTGIINVLELPATQVPLGLDEAGLPLGVQVISRRGADHRTIAVALELERAFGGWVPPQAA